MFAPNTTHKSESVVRRDRKFKDCRRLDAMICLQVKSTTFTQKRRQVELAHEGQGSEAKDTCLVGMGLVKRI